MPEGNRQTPSFTITYREVKGDEFLGEVAGKLLKMREVYEVKKDIENHTIRCTVRSHGTVDYAKVNVIAAASGASFIMKKD